MSTATIHPRVTRTVRSSLTKRDKPGWILMLPLLFFATRGTFSFQHTNSVGGFSPGKVPVHTPGLFAYGLAALTYAIVVWMIRSELRAVLSLAAHFKLLTSLALLAVFSTIWSQEPVYSASRGVFYLLGTLFAYYLVIRFTPQEIMASVSGFGVLVSLLNLVAALFFPQYGLGAGSEGVGVGWQGIFLDRTTAAKCFVFLLSPALVSRVGRGKASHIFYVLLLSLMILMAHAVSAIFVLAMCLFTLAVLRVSRKLDRRASVVFFLIGAAVAAVIATAAVEHTAEILQAFGRNANLSGRTQIWSALTESIGRRPLLGYGYYAFWLGLKGESGRVINATHWTFGYAHNGLLEICVQLGLVGAIIFLATLLKAVKNGWFCWKNDRTGRYDWYLALIVITIFYNIDESTVLWPNDLLSILYIVACCGLALAVTQLKQEKYLEELSDFGNHLPSSR